MSLVIAIPVLARPHRVPIVMSNVAATSSGRLLFIANEDDADEIAALQDHGADFLLVPPSRGSWACKINAAFDASTEEWLFTGADDLKFHPEWFERAMRWATENTGVIGTNDICNPRVMTGEHSTHSLFRRSYVERFGTIDEPGKVLCEKYRHDHVDDEAIATAKARGVYAHAFDSIVEHLHPMVGKSPEDSTYALGRKFSHEGRRLFHKRKVLWSNIRQVRTSLVPAPERAVVVTATYGRYDSQLRVPAEQDMEVDFVCFTDQPDLEVPLPWKAVVVEPRFPDNPRLSAKVPKMMPGEMGLDCEDVIWIDASHEITSPSFAREALAARQDGIAAFVHPRRTCVYQEIDALLTTENQNGLYFSRPLKEQAEAYRADGYPAGIGLFACGTLAWDLRNPKVAELGRAWMDETVKWSHQDQCEFPVVCHRLGISPGTFPVAQIDAKLTKRGKYLANEWFRIHRHVLGATSRFLKVSVLIPFSSQDAARRRNFEYVHSLYRSRGWEVLVGECEGEWSKGVALADAFSRATHDVLVIADADCIVEDEVLDRAIDMVREGIPWVMPHANTYRLDQNLTRNLLDGVDIGRRGARRHAAVGGGIVVCSREAWEKVGGIDPRFFGWGGEDISFGRALQTLCGELVQLNGRLLHLWHKPHNPRRGTPASEELAGRYLMANGDVEAMSALVNEARCLT